MLNSRSRNHFVKSGDGHHFTVELLGKPTGQTVRHFLIIVLLAIYYIINHALMLLIGWSFFITLLL